MSKTTLFLGLSKSFISVDHIILLNKLHCISLSATVNWLSIFSHLILFQCIYIYITLDFCLYVLPSSSGFSWKKGILIISMWHCKKDTEYMSWIFNCSFAHGLKIKIPKVERERSNHIVVEKHNMTLIDLFLKTLTTKWHHKDVNISQIFEKINPCIIQEHINILSINDKADTLQKYFGMLLTGLNSTALCACRWGDTDTFRCLLLFARQIPTLPHGEKG